MRAEVVTDVDELAALESEWAGLLDDADGSPTVHPRWYLAAARTLLDGDDLYAAVVHRGNALVAVAPFGRRTDGRGERLELLASQELREPASLAHRDRAGLVALVDALLAARRPLLLGRLAPESETVRYLASLPAHRAITVRRAATGTPYIPVTGDWGGFERSMGADRRSSLRRNLRRADEAGGFHFEVVAPDPGAVDAEVEAFVAVEDRSWKGEVGTSLAADARLRSFYTAYARASAEAGELRIARLRIGDELAAVQLAVERRRRLWILKLGYDEQWSRCAPGIVLTHLTLRWAFEHGLEAYELLGDEAPWTRVWTRRAHPYTAVRTYPISRRGLGAAVGDVAHEVRKRASAWG